MRSAALLMVVALLPSAHASGQETPPAGLAEVEAARSRACVGALDRLGDLGARIEPLAMRANRLRQLNQAIALEDSTAAAPFAADPVEAAVREWFTADQALGARYAETQDSAIAVQREEVKAAVRRRLQEEMDSIRVRAEAETVDAEEIEASAVPCQGAVLVRPIVLEECGAADAADSQLCQAAADTAMSPLFRFVDTAEDLWQIEELRPWSEPAPLQLLADGSLVGARTAVLARLGNIIVAVALSPMIQERAQVDSVRAAELDANLAALGFAFDDARFVMSPAFEVQANLPAPLGGETHYLLHFGDLATPDVVWTLPAAEGGVVQAAVPLEAEALERLKAGDPLSFTAVRMGDAPAEGTAPEAEFVYSLELNQVGQTRSTTGLLAYMAQGSLAADLKRIFPPGT